MKYLRTYENATQQATKLSFNKFKKYLDSNKHFNMSDRIIYRSVNLTEPYYYIDPWIPFNKYYEDDGKKYRMAAYSENYYTLLINHLPCWSEYPKRQVICSTEDYRVYGDAYRLIPLTNIKIGVVPSYDIQDHWNCKFYDKFDLSLYDLNSYYSESTPKRISDKNWEEFKESLERRYNATKNPLFDIDNLNEEITPSNLGFEVIDYKKFVSGVKLPITPPEFSNEIWLDQPHLLMKIE